LSRNPDSSWCEGGTRQAEPKGTARDFGCHAIFFGLPIFCIGRAASIVEAAFSVCELGANGGGVVAVVGGAVVEVLIETALELVGAGQESEGKKEDGDGKFEHGSLTHGHVNEAALGIKACVIE
jgi:hypothetical protein